MASINVEDDQEFNWGNSTPQRSLGGPTPIAPLHNIQENEEVPATRFDVYETYARILNNEDVSRPYRRMI
jgi:hypothetical protein